MSPCSCTSRYFHSTSSRMWMMMVAVFSFSLMIFSPGKTSAFIVTIKPPLSISFAPMLPQANARATERLPQNQCSSPHERQITSICVKGTDADDAADEKDTSNTFRKVDIIAAVAEKTGMNKKESEIAMKAVLDVISEQVKNGKRVNLPSFGTFTLKERAARKGRNPQTGEPLDIAASKSPSFSAAKAWKDMVNGK